MSDYISRQAAIDIAMNDRLIIDAMDSANDGDIHRTKRAIVRLLASLPSTQPEIIRCKDCKKNPHWEWVGCPMTGKNTRKPDDYCSYAERREEP